MENQISAQDTKLIASLQKKAGRVKLGQLLGWAMDDFDEDSRMRESILLDFLYDSLMFGVQKGFPWSQVCATLELAAEFQKASVGQSLSSSVKLYRDISTKYLTEARVSESNLRLFTSHLFETYMTHYQLYQLVFTVSREPMTVHQHLEVEPPPETGVLEEAKPHSIWEYEQKLSEIQADETRRLETLRAQRETAIKELESEQSFREADESSSLLDRMQVSQLIDDAIHRHANQMERLLQASVEERHEDLAFYLEKTALPRPEHLGPPPRTKEPFRTSAKSRASGKPEGKGSARSKKSKKSAKGN